MKRIRILKPLLSQAVALAICFSSFSLALGDQTVPLNISGGGAEDLLNVTTTPSAMQDSHQDHNVRFSCKDQYGRTVQKGNPAYDDCMLSAAGKAKQGNPNRGNPNLSITQ